MADILDDTDYDLSIDPDAPVLPIGEARIAFLDLVIPQLWAGGFDRLAAEYSVERDRLRSFLDAEAVR